MEADWPDEQELDSYFELCVRESYANGVEHFFTSHRYVHMAIRTNEQGRRANQMQDGYTPFFIDLFDTHNQHDGPPDFLFPLDSISGITLNMSTTLLNDGQTLFEIADAAQQYFPQTQNKLQDCNDFSGWYNCVACYENCD